MVILKRVGDLNSAALSSEFSVSVNLKGNKVQEVELVPGIYELTENLYSDKKINVSAEERCQSFDIITWEKEMCFQMNGSVLDKQIEGMVTWNTPKTYFKITPEDLYSSQDLTVYVLNQNLGEVPEKITGRKKTCGVEMMIGIPTAIGCTTDELKINGRVVEDLQLIGQMTKISRLPNVRKALEPRFS